MIKKHRRKYLLIACILILSTSPSFGQTSPGDYFRSAASGNWNATSTWESSTDGSTNWIPSTLVPNEAANTITIRNTHTVTISTNTTVDQVVVASGGILELATGSASALTINNGTGNDVIVQNGGVFRHNIIGSQLPVFAASSTMEIQKSGVLEVASSNGNPSDYANTNSSVSANILWADSSVYNWNSSGSPADGVTYFSAGNTIPIFRVSKPISIGNTAATVVNGLLEANASVSLLSTGLKNFRNGIVGTGAVGVSAVNGGQILINGTTAKLGGGSLTLNNSGLNINSATSLLLTTNKTIYNFSGSTGTVTLAGTLLAGDFLIDGNSKIQIDGTIKTTNVNGLSGSANTTFTSTFTVNGINASSTVEYSRTGDQVVTPLSYGNLTISGTGSKTVGAADVSVSGLLNIAASNTLALNGTNGLKLNGGGTLTINANAVFDNGGESQVTGGGSPTINIYGTFITRDAQGFTGTNTSIPGATSTSPSATVNIYPGSTIEYGRLGNQQITSRDDYKSMTFSGSGTKTLATFNPIGTVTIKDNAVVDASNKTFGDTTLCNLNMTGGRFIVGSTGTKPDIAGSYTLTGGVIEFAGGTASSRQNIRSTPTYLNIEVSGLNVGNSNSSTKLAAGGSFTIKNRGSYENTADKIDGTTGVQSFIMEAGSTFKSGVQSGFSGTGAEALSNIETITIDPKSTIIYSRVGNQTITPLAAGYPTLLLKGSGIKTVTSGTLTIAATADSVAIDPAVVFKVSSGAKANFNNRPVVVHSSATATGMIGEITDGSSALLNATNVTVERYIPARRAFRFIASPVTTTTSIKANWMEGQNNPPPAYSVNNNNYPGYGTHITGSSSNTNEFDATATNNPSLFTFNNASQAWEAATTTSSTLTAGNGYRLLIRGGRSVDLSNNSSAPSTTILRSTGTLRAGSITLDRTTTPSISSTTNNYSLIANPYASPVDWDALQKTGLSPYYTVWDPNLNTRGAYATYGNTATTPANSQVNGSLQSGQAFFVQTTSANPSLTFSETNKTTINRNVFRTSSSTTNLSIQLLTDTLGEPGNTADGVNVFFDDSFGAAIAAEDALKLTNLDENMAINRGGNLLSIEGRPSLSSADSIPLQISQYRQKNYFLQIAAQNFSNNVHAILKDNFLNTETALELSQTTVLPFSITDDTASLSPNRFMVILNLDRLLPITINDLKAFKKDAGIQVQWNVEIETSMEGYEVEKLKSGGHFEKCGLVAVRNYRNPNESYSWFDENINPGSNTYRIKSIAKSGAVEYSKVTSVNISQLKNAFTVFPNPVTGNAISLKMTNIESGTYTFSINNINGESVLAGTLNYDGRSGTSTINIGQRFSKGIYKLRLSNNTDSFFADLIFQ